MESFSIDLPDDIVKNMKDHVHIDWNTILLEKIKDYLHKLKIMDMITEKSTFEEKDSINIGRLINKSALESFVSKEE